MKHLTIGIFGDKNFLKRVAKQGTVNDIAIYNHSSSEGVFTYVTPNNDEKIHPLLQTINMIDVPVLVCNEINKTIAEEIVAIDSFGFERGFIISECEELKKIIRGTSLENFEWIEERYIREKLKLIDPISITDDVWVPVDNYFDVRSVGTVALSVIKGGCVKKHDKLKIFPLGNEVVVKSMQSQDKDINEASVGMRAGLNLKGIKAGDIKRGCVICSESSVSKNVNVDFTKNKYSKENIEEGYPVFFSVGLQVIPGKMEKIENGKLSLLLEHPAVFIPGQKCLLASTKNKMPRIIGSGKIM